MVYKRFRFIISIRVVLITLNVFLFLLAAVESDYIISAILLGVLIPMQVIFLIRYVERTNKKITQFLESIRHSDFSSTFSDPGLGKSFEGLSAAFNEVISEFRKNRAEKEEHYNYLQTVVQHISIGIISYRKDGKVDMYNNAVKKVFRISKLRNINDLSVIKDDLPELLFKLTAGNQILVKLFIEDELLQLSIHATELRLRGEEFTLISVQNIHSELEEKEIESWQKLIRVLTHEIMNSITPIFSLASTVREILFEAMEDRLQIKPLDDEDVESVEGALTTISNRSQGLLNFVEIYRNLTRIPKPNFRHFRIRELLDRAELLLKPKVEKLNIDCKADVYPEDLMITADPDLIDQVLINLMLNAIEAVKDKEEPRIRTTAYLNKNNRISIEVKDNGYGIKPDIMDKIFMPFFTSKKDGSGIGLSLSRQIMHLHKGTVSVRSKPGEGSVFTLTF